MVDSGMVFNVSSNLCGRNKEVYLEYKCYNCVETENQKKETLLELNSSQLIIKLLQEELSTLSSSKQPSANITFSDKEDSKVSTSHK
jgi:hypothetical protein